MRYEDVFAEFWVADNDSSKWVYKRKGTILRRWRQIKQDMWRAHISECEEYERSTETEELEEEQEQSPDDEGLDTSEVEFLW
jgi:hypothetical protein